MSDNKDGNKNTVSELRNMAEDVAFEKVDNNQDIEATVDEAIANDNRLKPAVLDYNRTHFVSHYGSDTFIFEETCDKTTGWKKIIRRSFTAVKEKNLARRVIVGGKSVPFIDQWLKHPNHREYDDVLFDPAEGPIFDNKYNLWQGFAVKPRQGGCWNLFKGHIRDIICAGDDKSYQYLICWIANRLSRNKIRTIVSHCSDGIRSLSSSLVVRRNCLIIAKFVRCACIPRRPLTCFSTRSDKVRLRSCCMAGREPGRRSFVRDWRTSSANIIVT